MTDNVVDFPTEQPKNPLLGPFTYYAVVVEGRKIPFLTGFHDDDKNTSIVVDNRFSISVPNERAYDLAWILAQAIAVASGYPHLGAESKYQPFAPIVSEMKL